MSLEECFNVYTSCACNRYPHCLDCNDGLVCFGSYNSVVLYDTEKHKVIHVLSKHQDVVNSVRWIDKEDRYLISSSADRTCVVWEKNDEHGYRIKWTLTGCEDAVIVAHSIRSRDGFVSVASSNDFKVRIWHNDEIKLTKNVGCFIFDVRLYDNLAIPGTILITAGSNERVDINRFDGTSLETLIILKGHQDWIKSIDLFTACSDKIMLASSSQDFLIRVYVIEPSQDETQVHQQSFEIDGRKFTVNLDTVLAGHDGWVNEVKWYCEPQSEKLYLLSSSMDKTIILWEQLDSIWNEKFRLGEMGGDSIGFIGCRMRDMHICGYSYTGAIHFWARNDDNWLPSIPITGHFNEVTDLVWEPEGEYFVTCSVDQTTRLHSFWKKNDSDEITWHEVARPQIHGYDLKSVDMAGRTKLISGADEKVIRVFETPKSFVESIKQINSIQITLSQESKVAESATVPALGLSNSAVYDAAGGQEIKLLQSPPSEAILLQETLWPETQKLYGHGYEIFSVACNHGATILASACKAASAKHAAIILWDLKTYKSIASLTSHNLTVTRMKFSPDDQFLLSVSRDRTWSIFNVSLPDYPRVAFTNKTNGVHTRIIWDCAWLPGARHFVTVSRDKSAISWNILDEEEDKTLVVKSGHLVALEESITSVDVHKSARLADGSYVACLGLESGAFFLYSISHQHGWCLLHSFEHFWHTKMINRVAFSSKVSQHDDNIELHLATCGVDQMVKLFKLKLKC